MSVGPVATTPAGGAGVAPSAGVSPTGTSAQPAASGTTAAETAAQPLTGPEAALAAMIGEAVGLQDSLAPFLANLAVAVTSNAMPQAALATASQILGAQAPLDETVNGQSLRAAVQASGLFLEAGLAGEALGPNGGPSPGFQPDLKALLLRLTDDLAPQNETQTPSPPTAQPAATAAITAQTAANLATAQKPEPPVGGGPTAGQPAARPTLDPEAGDLTRAVGQQAQAALARVQLSQAASVPKAGEPVRWSFELPVATPDGPAVAQFQISRDGGGGAAAAAEPAWRVRFSVDVPPSGPIHAEVVLSKGRARVTLMAEDDDARQALAANQGELVETLAAEQGNDVAVRVVGGAPKRPSLPPGQLLDRRS